MTAFVTDKSACCGVTVALAVLLVGLGSAWSAARIVAVLVLAPTVVTVAVIASVTEAPLLSAPTVQIPEALRLPLRQVKARHLEVLGPHQLKPILDVRFDTAGRVDVVRQVL